MVRPFAGQAPSRTIAMVWRSSSALGGFLREFAQVFKQLPKGLLELKA
jgi:LysR family hydrogen peroxide-inducible transcriptional activator